MDNNNYSQNNSENGWDFAPQQPGSYDPNAYTRNGYYHNPYVGNGYSQNPSGQNGYAQNPYGQNGYDQNPYGQNGYNQNPYGRNGYPQNPPAQNSYNPTPEGPADAGRAKPPRSNGMAALIVKLVAAGLEVLLIAAFVVVYLLTPPPTESASAADSQAAGEEIEAAEAVEEDDEETPEEEESSSGLVLPEGDGVSVEFEYSNSGRIEYGIVHGYDASGNEVWSYESDTYAPTELQGVVGLGEHDGLYYLCEDSGIVALYITDGSVAWCAEDCVGSAMDIAFDDAGNAYITSYYGPDLTIISQQGEVLAVEDELHPQAIWPYEIDVSDGTIAVTYESGLMDFAAGGTVRVSVSDYID